VGFFENRFCGSKLEFREIRFCDNKCDFRGNWFVTAWGFFFENRFCGSKREFRENRLTDSRCLLYDLNEFLSVSSKFIHSFG